MNEKEVIYEVPVGQYTADQADSVLEYEFEVDGEEFYHLTIYDGPGNGFSGTIAVYGNGGVISMDNMLVQEPGFSRVSGTEVKHGFYVGNNPDQIVTLRLKFDYYPNEVAYELRNVDGNITMGLAWFETFQSGTKNQIVKIPVYGPERGDQKYEFQIWDAGGERAIQFDCLFMFRRVISRYLFTFYSAEDGICCTFGQGKYQLFLGPITDQVVLTSGGDFELTETFEFDIEGELVTPSPVVPIVPIPIDTPKTPPSTPTSAQLELAENPVPPSKMPSDAANATASFGETGINTPTPAPQLRNPSEESTNSNENTDGEETRDANSSSGHRLWTSCLLVLAGCIIL